jgi:hypothetical protein
MNLGYAGPRLVEELVGGLAREVTLGSAENIGSTLTSLTHFERSPVP